MATISKRHRMNMPKGGNVPPPSRVPLALKNDTPPPKPSPAVTTRPGAANTQTRRFGPPSGG